MELEQRSIRHLDMQAEGVGRAVGAMSAHAADIGPPRGGDAPSAFPECEPRRDDDDASEIIHRVELQLLAKPGRPRTGDCVGSRMMAAMLS